MAPDPARRRQWQWSSSTFVQYAAALSASGVGIYALYRLYTSYDPPDGSVSPLILQEELAASAAASSQAASSGADKAHSALLGENLPSNDASGGNNSEEANLDVAVSSRFQAAMRVAATTALPSTLNRVRAQVEKVADTAPVTNELMAMRKAASAASAEGARDQDAVRSEQSARKRELWHELLVVSFARCAASPWLGALALMLTRTTLAALGRHEVLQANLLDGGDNEDDEDDDEDGFHAAAGNGTAVDTTCDRKFLDDAVAHLQNVGVSKMMQVATESARAALSGVALDTPIDAPTLRALLGSVHAGIEARVMAGGGWRSYVLPPTSTRKPPTYAEIATSAPPASASAPPEGSAESRCQRAFETPLFSDAMRAAAAPLTASAGDAVIMSMAGGAMPLAKLVASVAAAPARCLVHAGGGYDDAAECREVDALVCACFASL
ncbi:hypothetical protein PPROV_000465100 [Pycnococcus provasolii]|uniref:Peroxin-3 n=1 Tax=Pycnococcus provasolii TaxID=41880 RepID=A0A830HFP9_9CHLO|nr:hypothetical protein PPROV_000465100 [Pycnococcus provasolii]